MGSGTSDIGQLGLFLTLAFVLPGFVYLGFFILYFPEIYKDLNKLYPGEFFAIYIAVIGGLLLTSICFGIEIMCRKLDQIRLKKLKEAFEKWFPYMGQHHMPLIEYEEKGIVYLNQLTGQAYMHFNIFMGVLIISILYIISNYQNLNIIKIVIGGVIIVFNFFVAHTMYKWGKAAIDSVVRIRKEKLKK